MRTLAFAVTLAGLMFFLPGIALAHRMPVTVSVVEPLEVNTWGVSHRIHGHDAISILARDPEISQPELETLRSRAKVALYVQDRFRIRWRDEEGNIQKVIGEIIGAEIEGDYLMVYQEFEVPAQGFSVSSSILSDILPGWFNHVEVTGTDSAHTLKFSRENEWRTTGQ